MIQNFLKEFRGPLLIIYAIVVGILLIALLTAALVFGVTDVFSLGQLIVEVLLLPIVIIGFLFAAEQFRKSLEQPNLDIYWEVETEKFSRELKLLHTPYFTGQQGGRFTGTVVVQNKGDAVSEWFQVEIRVPLELIGSDDPEEIWARWHRNVGEDANWEVTVTPDDLRVLFRSNGQIAAYVDDPLFLGFSHLYPPALTEDAGYQVPYKIVTNKGGRKEGKLRVYVQVVSLGR